jgi:hypothetical protein
MHTYLDAKPFDKDLLDAEVFDVDARDEHIPLRVRHPEVDRGVQFDLGPMLHIIQKTFSPEKLAKVLFAKIATWFYV